LTVGKVQAMFTSLVRLNGTRSRPLSPATLQRIRGCLHVALNGAIRRGLITHNPAHWVELPSGRRPHAVVWTEVLMVSHQVRDHNGRAVICPPKTESSIRAPDRKRVAAAERQPAGGRP
jgi:hypothetical protein